MPGLGSQRQPSIWRGLPAWRLASDDLSVVICPARGGRITSVFAPHAGREWLVPAPLQPLRPLTYGALWSAYEMCGWDDAFPTVGDCAFPGPGRAAGVHLPDHGEVWALEWTDSTDAAGEGVVCSVAGAALPYRLTRRAGVAGATLTLEYSLVNEGDDPLPFQWAAYPLIDRRPDTEVVVGQSWAAAVDRATGHWLRLDWDPAEVPWCSVLEDDGGRNPRPNVVLLPSTGRGPDLRAAVATGDVRVVEAGGEARWSLRATVGRGPLRSVPP